MKALVIDDSKAMRIILKQILQSVGGTVEEAGNGKEGLEKLKTIGKPDIVLVDWNMPEMNGLEFCPGSSRESNLSNIAAHDGDDRNGIVANGESTGGWCQ